MNLPISIGRVYANNLNDSENINSIKHGFLCGVGLLGEAQVAAYKMALLYDKSCYFESDLPADNTAKIAQALADSRVEFYHTLKAIESASSGIERRLLGLHELLKLCLPHVQAAAQAEHTLSCVGPRHELPIDRLLGEVKAALK